MNEQNKSPGQLAYEFLSSLSSNPLFKWSSLDIQWQQSWEQTAAFMAGKTTQAPVPEDKWAREKEHFAKGGRIQFDVGDGTWRDWSPANAPAFPNSWGAWRIHPEDIKPDNCPTCGSTEKQNRNKVFPSGSLCGDACTSPWHTSVSLCPACSFPRDDARWLGGDLGYCKDPFHASSGAATPAPEPWRPKYVVGQEVEHVALGGCRAIISEILPFSAYKVRGSVGHWDESGFKWILLTPPAGHSWRMKYPWPTSRDQVNLAR